ncbi:MAG: 4-hydroxy-tetrahydrodipicolinate reductase [Peptococcaceae bacterium]|jgi:4-hydroxy-tetrahydrodipicolinate reductase|nr:4-hydroxy-tetrahydrodipicolinate reductase [Peptococcaceae bacterium]
MIDVLLSGCNGRMGQAVVSQCGPAGPRIVAGYDQSAVKQNDFPVYDSFSLIAEAADLVIDFSHISATPAVLAYCQAKGLPLVLCTTGIKGDLEAKVLAAAAAIPIFKSFNMSLGISLLLSLARQAAKVLGDTCDIEIIEKHHNQKLDAPSGTALMIADAAAAGLNFQAEYIRDRGLRQSKRGRGEIGIHSVRGGAIVGEHEAMFICPQEIISISHSAQSREIFARGAVKAAGFLLGKKPGIYTMDDLVNSLIQ